MNSDQQEEIESLKAIFCKKDEILANEDSQSQHIRVNFSLNNSSTTCSLSQQRMDELSASISFLLPIDYPAHQLPEITLTCSSLPASTVLAIRAQLSERAAALLGQSMLLDLCCYAQELFVSKVENLQETSQKTVGGDEDSQCEKLFAGDCSIQKQIREESLSKTAQCRSKSCKKLETSHFSIVRDTCVECKDSSTKVKCTGILHEELAGGGNCKVSESGSQPVTALLQLDHMRSRQSYVRLIKKWTAELGLAGRLMFHGKLILILLQGDQQAVKEYIVRNRTTNVDVDSKGRQCKERMLTVLCEVLAESHVRLSDFCVVELDSMESLKELFQKFSMEGLYQDYLSNFVYISAARK